MGHDIEPITGIAVVATAGRFPGARDVDALWRHVVSGDDLLVDLDPNDLLMRGVRRSEVFDPEYVRRAGVIADVESFDAEFFGIGDREAALMDPQHRHFLECCWEALEQAGVDPSRHDDAVGVFAGCGANTYLLNNVLPHRDLVEDLGWFLIRHTGNDKDFLATGVSYRLDLRGPSVNVQTACSTSLVAVHLAVQSLLSFECDLALAGGVTIDVPHGVGYRARQGEILSPEGRCRAFDAASSGTVLTGGAAVVGLKRLEDARRDRNEVLAVIIGSAVNNDGRRKVSFLAPSVDGHADVVRSALAEAGISARDIQLLEAHGTGTEVGDPIEVAALTEAFRSYTEDVGFCRLGSLKPNIGHLDTAAGVASLIKVVQALRHRTLPPLANHTAPNPLIDLPASPFVVSDRPDPWPGGTRRRAGVSSLGVGGTNAHVVVEEASPAPATAPGYPYQLIVVSAREASLVDAAAARLADALEQRPDLDLADVAHTLARGRKAFPHRRILVARDASEAEALLRASDARPRSDAVAAERPPRVVLLFPGGGSQYPRMALGLDRRFDTFHEVFRAGASSVLSMSGIDVIRSIEEGSDAEIGSPLISLPSVFLTSVALAEQWRAWGVRPDALLGHSLGEYAAAHLAGVMSYEDALHLVMLRAELMERVSSTGGAMLVVPLDETRASEFLADELSLAAVNAHDECVLAGSVSAVERASRELRRVGLDAVRLPLAAAAHSWMLDPVLDEFGAAVAKVQLQPPSMPLLSNLHGTWATAEQVTRPDSWVAHLRNTVRFSDCVATVLAQGPTVMVEFGPGTLSSYARRGTPSPIAAIPTLRHPRQEIDDTVHALASFGRLWTHGVDVDPGVPSGTERRMVVLPTYPFRRDRHWIEPPPPTDPVDAPNEFARIGDPAQMRWTHEWSAFSVSERDEAVCHVVPIGDDDSSADDVTQGLASRGVVVHRRSSEDLLRDPAALEAGEVVVLTGPIGVRRAPFDAARHDWLTTARRIVHALGTTGVPRRVVVLTHGAYGFEGPSGRPEQALAAGLARVASHEYPCLDVIHVDLADEASPITSEAGAPWAGVVSAVLGRHGEPVVCVARGAPHRSGLQRLLAPTGLPPADAQGPWLVTGGLGAVGFAAACALAASGIGHLVLTVSAPLPDVDLEVWARSHAPEHPDSVRLRRLEQLRRTGACIEVVAADLMDDDVVTALLDELSARPQRLAGVVHAAGVLADGLIGRADDDDIDHVVGVKAAAALRIVERARDRGVPRVVLVSSTSTLLAGAGQMAYIGANAVLDALAGRHGDTDVVTIGLGAVRGAGMATSLARRVRLGVREGERVEHPVFDTIHVDACRTADGRETRVAGQWAAFEASGTLDSSWQWVLAEHRTATGRPLLPGAGHVALLVAAARLADGDGDEIIAFDDLRLLAPISVEPESPVRIQVRQEPDGRMELRSDAGPGVDWIVHTRAIRRPSTPPGAAEASCASDGATMIDPMSAQRNRLRLGPRWNASAALIHATPDEVVASVGIDESFVGDLDGWQVHPALLDFGIGLAVTLHEGAAGSSSDTDVVVPTGWASIDVFRSMPADTRMRVRRVENEEYDLEVADHHGELVLVGRGLRLRRVPFGWDEHACSERSLVERGAGADAWVADVREGLGFASLAESVGLDLSDVECLFRLALTDAHSRVLTSSIDLPALVALTSTSATPAGPPSAVDQRTEQAADDTRKKVRAAWAKHLGRDDVRDDTDFFDAGGHSLIAIRLLATLQRELGVRLQLSDVFDAPTLGQQVDLINRRLPTPGLSSSSGGAGGASGGHRSLVAISRSGSGPALFIVHGAGGNVMFLSGLARALSARHAVYGFQAIGIDGTEMPDPTIDAMADRYVAELRAAHRGPYVLGGYSGGGLVALEMARRLVEAGDEVARVLLFDSVPPGRATRRRSERWTSVLSHARAGRARDVKPYVRSVAAHAFHRLVPMGRERARALEEQALAVGHGGEGRGVVNLYHVFSSVADRHLLKPLKVDATVFQADLVWPTQPPDYHWSGLIQGDIRYVRVPGDHHSMFFAENVGWLAEAVHENVNKAFDGSITTSPTSTPT